MGVVMKNSLTKKKTSSVHSTQRILLELILHHGVIAENNPGSSAIDWWLLTVSNPLPFSLLNILSVKSSFRTVVNLFIIRRIKKNKPAITQTFKYLMIGPKMGPPHRSFVFHASSKRTANLLHYHQLWIDVINMLRQ